MSDPAKAVVVGISGCSSSGKTTLSRLLRDIFPHTFVLHEDDFYRPETELPTKHGLLDWDCAEALSIPDIAQSLKHIRQHGSIPPTLSSKEDQNSIGACPVPNTVIDDLRARVKHWTEPGQPGHEILTHSHRLCIFDGFLLYAPALAAVQPQLDIKLFLRVSYAQAKARREARSGYVTLEGFWEDPPGYVDKIVWPNYVEEHSWMFEQADVQGQLRTEVQTDHGIRCQDGGVDVDMTTTLQWAVELIMAQLPLLGKS